MNEIDFATAQETVTRMREIVFQILCDIDEFCKENNINYYLSGGTCLGAVRHNDFIPWDDDGDIMMPRKDYDRFIQLFPQKYSNQYGVGSIEFDEEWQRPYARVYDLKTKWRSRLVHEKTMGVLVDVFPIDGTPKGAIRKSLFFFKLHVYNVLRNAAVRNEYIPGESGVAIKKILSYIARPFGARYFAKKIYYTAKKYDFDTSDYVACSVPVHYGKRELIEKEKMKSSTSMLFHGKKFPVPMGYDTYLSNLYGDYMTPPKDAKENGYTHLSFWEIEL